jgi:hypothetical protein
VEGADVHTYPDGRRVRGVDWMQAIELAARFIASECQKDGTFDLQIYPRDA